LQAIIDAAHKLSADNVDDTNATNKFATAAQLSQIETNKTNISLKANTSDVNTAAASLQAQIDNIVSGSTEDSEVINARVGADGTSYQTLKARLDAETDDAVYPFNMVPGNATAVKSIIDFKFYTDDTTKTVKLMRILRNTSNVYAVTITVDGVSYNILNIAASAYTEKSYNIFNIANVGYGYFIIDWTSLTSGTYYHDINSELKQIYKIIPEPSDHIPFEFTRNETKDEAINAISCFVIYLKDVSQSVKLMRVIKNSGNVYAVVISIDGVNYNILNIVASSYVEKSYNAFNIAGVCYGYFVINWNALTNTSYGGIQAELKQNYKFGYDENYQDVEILLPDVINVTVGKEISLEYYNIIRCSNVEEFQIEISSVSAQIQNLSTRLRIAPTAAGTTNETISIIKNDFVVATKSFQIVAAADTKPAIKAIFIGDSMTNAAIYISELVNMLGADKLTLYGTRSIAAADSEGAVRTIYHEGRAGWSTKNYVTDASVSDVTNAFYNGGFDFSYYMSNNPSFNDVTDVFILLGTNDGNRTDYGANYKAICDSIKEYSSSIRIHCLLPIPPVKDGYAFGSRNNISYMSFKNYMFNNAKTILNMYQDESGYSIVPINANLDCWYDFPQTEVAVNSRNPQQITVLNDNVHPSKYGYYRFADVIYCDIIANCQ
jgi:hypothetical protein